MERMLKSSSTIGILIIISIGSCIYWSLEFKPQTNNVFEPKSITETMTDKKQKADEKLDKITQLMKEMEDTKNKTDDKISQLMNEIDVLKLHNSQLQNAKSILIEQQRNQTNDDFIPKIDLLLSEMDKLNNKIWKLEELEKQNTLQQHALLQQLQLLQYNNSVIRYYFLYGFCEGRDTNLLSIMENFKYYVQKTYPHWIVFNISVEQFLIDTKYSYTHQKLLQFTQTMVPNINITQDKFQWIFHPYCGYKKGYKNIKAYYAQNGTKALEMPPNIYQYYNISTQNDYGYMDDNERSYWSHVVHINDHHHQYRNIFTNQSYNLHIPYSDRVLNVWQNNSYYSSDMKYALSLNNHRPFLVQGSGEAFDAYHIRQHDDWCPGDLHIQRTASWPTRGCIVVAYIQGIAQRDIHYEYKNYQNQLNYNRLIVNGDKKVHDLYVQQVLEQKKHFCSFTVKTFMIFTHYLADALVRHVVHHMISTQYKYCDMLGFYHQEQQDTDLLCNENHPKYTGGAGVSHHLLGECQKPFKFSINMENTATYGYTSEKIYTGLIANTIPIYFGNKDIHKIVNKERIILCDVPDDVLIKKREEYHALYNELRAKYGDVYKNETAHRIVKQVVFKWAMNSYSPYVQSCVDEVIRVDTNDTLYRHKLSQPIIPNNTFANSHYDGSIIHKSIIDTLAFLNTSLFE